MTSLDDASTVPAPELTSGDTVAVAVPGDSPALTAHAEVLGVGNGCIKVSPAPAMEAGGECLLYVGEVGGRVVGRCVVESAGPQGAVLVAPGEWKQVDARTHRRVRTRLRADVRSEESGDEFFGVTIDISAGGMAVEVLDDPGVDHISVCAGLREDLEYLPCEVVGRREQNGVTVLHLRFGAMNASQAEHARQLIEDIERAIAA